MATEKWDEVKALIENMSVRELVEVGKSLNGGSFGCDFSKLKKPELQGKVRTFAYAKAGAMFKARYGADQSFTHASLEQRTETYQAVIELMRSALGNRTEAEEVEAREEAEEENDMFGAQEDDSEEVRKLLEIVRKKRQATINPEQVRAIVRKELEGLVLPVTVQIRTDKGEAKKLDGVHHRQFPELISYLQAGVNVWIFGAAGTGKTTGVENAAKVLGKDFYSDGVTDSEHKLLGFKNITGEYQRTQFREAFEHGGVYLADEIDGWLPEAAMTLQSALANGFCSFPDRKVEKHKNFLCCGAANTVGHGANADYVGRNRMDGAFLDRFVFLDWPVDEAMERAVSGNDKWVSYVQNVRARVAANGIKVIVSPRASIYGARLLASGVNWDNVVRATLRKGMTDEQWKGVA